MSKNKKTILFGVIYAVVAVGILLAVWSIAAYFIDSEVILPTVDVTFGKFGVIFTNVLFWRALGGTMVRSVIGFGISLLLFFVTYYLSTAYAGFKRIAEPIISALRSLPAVAITLVLALMVGGFWTPVVLGVLVIFPIMYSAACARTATVSVDLMRECKLNGASHMQTFASLWLPCLAGAMPETAATAFSYNIKAVIGAEILASTAASLGALMKTAQQYPQMPMLIAYVIVAVFVAVVSEIIIRAVLKRALVKYAE